MTGVNTFLCSSPEKRTVPNPSPKAICPLETIIQSNLIQVLFLCYQAINWAEYYCHLHCAQGFCATKAKPRPPYMLQLDNTLFGFNLCISSGQSTPEVDPSLLSPSALCSAQELSEASPAAKNRVPNNAADQSAGCHRLSLQILPSQPCSSSSAKTSAPVVNRFKELVCLKSNPFFERVHSTLLSGVLILVGTSTLQLHSFPLYLN